jgi:CubicO group peptidase (beta-lactamase class C family)
MQGNVEFMKQSAYFFLVCIFLWSCGQANDSRMDSIENSASGLGNQVTELARDHEMSGVILVAIDGESIYEKAFNVEPLRTSFEITVDSTFAIASITKSFTATTVLSEVEAGRIDLDATIRDYLPSFSAVYADDVKVRQLLESRSGIPHYVDIPGWFEADVVSRFTPETFLEEIAALELRFEPGEDYYYSNANYYLLGLILDAAAGKTYEAVLEEAILEPLGLEDIGQIYAPGPQVIAPTYIRDGESYELMKLGNPALFRATGSQFSTARDLVAFGHGLLRGTILGEEMLTVLLDEDRPMGFTVTSVPIAEQEVPVVTYNGELAGTTTILTMFPEQNSSIVILSNNNLPYTALVDMTLSIAQIAFGEH